MYDSLPMADQDPLTELELSKQPLEEKAQKSKGGRRRHAPDVGVWSIRSVEYETRTAFEKAADRVNKTIGKRFTYCVPIIRGLVKSVINCNVIFALLSKKWFYS